MGSEKNTKLLAFDGINREYKSFESIEDARAFLEESFLDKKEGYHPDLTTSMIYELKESVDYDIVASKSDYTDKEWKEADYPEEFEEIWKHKFVPFTSPLLDLLPSNKERIRLAMVVSESTDVKVLTDIVATVDLIIDRMKKKAGIPAGKLDDQQSSTGISKEAPNNYQKVRWQTPLDHAKDKWKEGRYSNEGLFCLGFEDDVCQWDLEDDVLIWEALNDE